MDKFSKRVRDRLHEIWVDTREDRMQWGRTTRSRCLVGVQKKCEEKKERCERIQGQV